MGKVDEQQDKKKFINSNFFLMQSIVYKHCQPLRVHSEGEGGGGDGLELGSGRRGAGGGGL